VAFDEMRQAYMLIKPLCADRRFSPRPLADSDITLIQEQLQRSHLPRIGLQATRQAVEVCAKETRYHPLRDWMDSLEWDGRPRLAGGVHLGETLSPFALRYLGAEATEYNVAVTTMFWISMAARVMEPGCKADYMLILEGRQGSGKSTFCQVVGGEYFSDSLPDLRVKDAFMHLRGRLLIEIPEMAAVSRAELAVMKSFVTRTEERYRPSHGRLEVTEPRQCVFIGTTNKSEYLRDPTGARRFWPIKTGRIDIEATQRDRDQLFAEAVQRYRTGENWFPDNEFERVYIAPQQEARYETDAWEDSIGSYLASKTKVLVKDVAREALRLGEDRIGTSEQRRITTIFERLGWERCPKDGRGNRPWRKMPLG
jgi:predicted P-loop ATPase